MERRNFLRNIGTGSLAVGLSSFIAPMAYSSEIKSEAIKELIPKHLSEGDTIGIISPASNKFESEPYEIAVETFQAMGLKVKLGNHVNAHYGHLAGTDEDRAADLNNMFKDPEVNAIIALRGGSGAARILDKIDYESILKNPKIFKDTATLPQYTRQSMQKPGWLPSTVLWPFLNGIILATPSLRKYFSINRRTSMKILRRQGIILFR